MSCSRVVVRPDGRTADEKLAFIAGRSHGVVTRAEMLRLGISAAEIKHRVRAGRLLREHRGVYRVGHRSPSLEARCLAAVRACGDGALLSGRATGHLFGVLRGSAPVPEVTTPTERRVPGVRTHRSRHIDSRDATILLGIPVTTLARTLVDLAAVLGPDDLARAVHEAAVKYGTTPRQVEAVLERRPYSPGAAALRAVLRGETRVTLSKLERAFLSLLEGDGLVLPRTNLRVGARRVDCHWREQRLTVELDSYRYHHSRHAWEQDRRREREARARAYEFRRYTYGDVLERPGLMLDELRALLPRGCPAQGR